MKKVDGYNLSKYDIPVDQSNFHRLNERLGNKGYVLYDENDVVYRYFYGK